MKKPSGESRYVRQFIRCALALVALSMPTASYSQESSLAAVVDFSTSYSITPNVTYHKSGGWEGKLDLYIPRGVEGPIPALIWYFGGGWVISSKEADGNVLLPYLEMGFAVINVSYRLAETAPAPAAAVDAICALRWVSRNAETYNLDRDRIVVAGRSSGGHLALFVALSPSDYELVPQCSTTNEYVANQLQPVRAAAVVNWFGVTDVVDVIEGPNSLLWAQSWLSGANDRLALAKALSPISLVTPDDPPVVSVHGDADPLVPYSHAERLHKTLDRVGVANQLITIKGGGHSGFTGDEYLRSYQAIEAFLTKHVLSQK